MNQENLSGSIKELTKRALWEVKNVIDCIPEELWEKEYCEMPLWKHVYHMLHSLDLWFMNPRDSDFTEPSFHTPELNNLDYVTSGFLSREQLERYFMSINKKIKDYVEILEDSELYTYPSGCEYNRFTLILSQFRHLHTHMGMLMGFIVEKTGKWPVVLGLEGELPKAGYDKFFGCTDAF